MIPVLAIAAVMAAGGHGTIRCANGQSLRVRLTGKGHGWSLGIDFGELKIER
jgi:hypothetical protein